MGGIFLHFLIDSVLYLCYNAQTMINNDILTEEQRKLIINNYKLLQKFYNQEIRKGYIPKDRESEFYGYLQKRFCVSALKFDKERGFKFSTFAYRGFKRGISDIKKSIVKDGCKLSIDRLGYLIGDEKSFSISGNIIWNSINGWIADNKFNNEKMIDIIDKVSLTEREKKVINLYCENLSFSKIAKEIGFSKETSRKSFLSALVKIKTFFNKTKYDINDFYK